MLTAKGTSRKRKIIYAAIITISLGSSVLFLFKYYILTRPNKAASSAWSDKAYQVLIGEAPSKVEEAEIETELHEQIILDGSSPKAADSSIFQDARFTALVDNFHYLPPAVVLGNQDILK